MSEIGINCSQCQCNFFSARINVQNSELLLSCEMCERTMTLSVDEFSVRMLKDLNTQQKIGR